MKVIENNPLFPLQYIAYNRAVLQNDSSVEDFAKYCKFVLCKKYKLPYEISVLNEYTSEQLIIEYFMHVYSDDAETREKFEEQLIRLKLLSPKKSTHDWLDEMVDKENKNIKDNYDTNLEPIKFTPGDT